MDKEEILARSRAEHQNRDLVELEAVSRANNAALTAGILLCVLLTALHRAVLGSVDIGIWAVDWGIMATLYAVKFARLRRRRDLAMGLLGLALFAGFLWFYLHLTLGVI